MTDAELQGLPRLTREEAKTLSPGTKLTWCNGNGAYWDNHVEYAFHGRASSNGILVDSKQGPTEAPTSGFASPKALGPQYSNDIAKLLGIPLPPSLPPSDTGQNDVQPF